MRAEYLIIENIKGLLVSQRKSQVGLARYMGHKRSWINKILNGHRRLQIEDFDKVADFFHLATYQLFQPGVSSTTERRMGPRRKGEDRRISDQERELLLTSRELARVGARGHRDRSASLAVASSVDSRRENMERAAADAFQRLAPLIPQEDVRRQAPMARVAKPKDARTAGTRSRSDHPVPRVKGGKR